MQYQIRSFSIFFLENFGILDFDFLQERLEFLALGPPWVLNKIARKFVYLDIRFRHVRIVEGFENNFQKFLV